MGISKDKKIAFQKIYNYYQRRLTKEGLTKFEYDIVYSNKQDIVVIINYKHKKINIVNIGHGKEENIINYSKGFSGEYDTSLDNIWWYKDRNKIKFIIV